MDWKTPVVGIVLIIVLGVGGLVYRNVAEHAGQQVACPVDAKVCPDGTSVAHTGLSCTFPACPPPNVTLEAAGIAYAIPAGFSAVVPVNPAVLAEYDGTPMATASSTDATLAPPAITVSRYQIASSSTALATIQASAISGASGAPVPTSAYTATNIGEHHFTVVEIERFEGVVDTAYYLAREGRGDVLRFDAIDRGVDWTNPALDVPLLPAHAALVKLLATLQGE